ncbi:glyoxylase-like metal-dependent hydrolase (beta-lactamase superfamily II) [Halarchaeum rubridurum]|uniref:Glyoxylase-like metal-dependent hydrolase (Beta-lactamase superfamily II) n=1 Tax=Halarchaeum rubridurum TaxID=489911 RepID=A0A830FT77_9EURY|nr:MBL fold metallo-hydrolase [Halarchaeum rubridurum]MBP1954139.1 glyoxylase-like metal-dependent hydrolase (beta-lactamase superfamily II) [Halarchaeum rubridurum]GGM57657.1 MBL fold hydrolase [Halarchaeum rubridurum]
MPPTDTSPGDVARVDACTDVHYVDTGMYDTPGYGAVYVLDGERPAVLDTGIGTHHDRVLDALDAVGIAREDLAAIVVSHVHLDHAGGAGFLAAACPNADVYVHEVGAPHLVDPADLVAGTKRAVGDQWRYYVEPEPVPEDRVVELVDGDAIDLGDRTLTAHHAPGHAPHQVVLEDDRDGFVHTADAAGIWVPALGEVHETSPPPNFDLETCLDDVETIRGCDPDVLLYPHFGPVAEDVDGVLDDYADTLTEWVARVREKRAELDDDEAVERYFAERTALDGVWPAHKAAEEVAMNVRGVLVALDRGLA